MVSVANDLSLIDNGGRRLGIDRRLFAYSAHIPERRSVRDRRSGKVRRNGKDRRQFSDATLSFERRTGGERRASFQKYRDQNQWQGIQVQSC